MAEPLAYFLTFTTYGTWLHGRDSGSVDRNHNVWGTSVVPPNPEQELVERQAMRHPEYLLDEARRQVVLQTILEVARHRGWKLWAAHVRSNHVHIVVSGSARPEKMMVDFKAWASRRLRESFAEDANRERWTQHGSTRYVWNEQALDDVNVYVLDQQGERMAYYDGRSESNSTIEGGSI